MSNRKMVMKGLVCSFSASGPSAQAPECPCCFRFIAKRKGTTCDAVVAEQAYKLLKEQPEQKHGHWKDDKYGNMLCSVCGGLAIQSMTGCLVDRHLASYLSNYCPHCGAKMDEEVKQDG